MFAATRGWLLLALWLWAQAGLIAAQPASESRVRALAEQWLTLLDSRSGDAGAYRALLAESGWELHLIEGRASSPAELERLLQQRFAGLAASHHRISYFKFEPGPDGRLRLWLELDWAGRQSDGLEAVARLDLALTLRESEDGRLQILELSERYLPPPQSNGARIKC